jgi:hypothetical protein
MGKIILAGVLMLALAPATLVGLPSKGAKLAREAAKLESKYEGQIGGIWESYGGSCPGKGLSEEEYSDYQHKIDSLNNRRDRDFRRHGLSSPFPYSYCGGEGYGYN